MKGYTNTDIFNSNGAIGCALYQAQLGHHPDCAKPLKGFSGAQVLELAEEIYEKKYKDS